MLPYVAQSRWWDHKSECAGKASSNKEGDVVGWLGIRPKKWVFRLCLQIVIEGADWISTKMSHQTEGAQ